MKQKTIKHSAMPLGDRVRASLLNWLGIPVSLTSDDFWREWAGRSSDAGIPITYDTMMTLSAVWSCVRLIAESISTLPLVLYERTAHGRVRAVNHPLYNVLAMMPNAGTTATVHWEAQIAAMLMRGWGRAEKLMVGSRVVGLQFLDPCRLMGTRQADGTLRFTYKELNGRSRDVPNDRIFGLPGFSLNGVDGLSAIQYGYNIFGNALAADKAAGSTFKNGLMPTVYFYMERVLSKSQREEFRENFKTNIAGSLNAGKSPLLEGGMKADSIGINPTDAQLLESRSFSVEEVCRWFRVPPWMIGHAGQSTTKWGTGMEQELLGFLTFTLRPWLRRIEQGVVKDLLTPSERTRHYAQYDLTDFLRADSAARAAFYSAMVNNGLMTRDEVREKEDLPPRGGNADVLTVQTALTPLDSLGQGSSTDQALNTLAKFFTATSTGGSSNE